MYGEEDFEIKAQVNDSGKFVVFFDAVTPGFYTFKYGGEYAKLYLSPGDSLHLSLDPDQFDESLQFKGSGAGINNYLIGKYLLDEKMDMEYPYRERFAVTAEEYMDLVDSMTKVRQDFLDRSTLKHELPEMFVAEEQVAIDYEQGIALYEYENAAAYYQEVESVEVPEGYYAFTGELQVENEGMLGNDTYERYANTHLNHLANARLEDNDLYEGDLAFTSLKFDCITEVFTSQELKDKFLHQTMMDALNYYGSQDMTEVLAKFTECCKDKKCVDVVTKEVEGWKVLWKGNPAPTFAYNDVDGNTIDISELKGRVVYVDVWASWCGPCRREIPFLKDLEHDYHGMDISFVSVSIDENEKAWRQSVEDNELGGFQLLADGAWESTICSDYKIQGIPRFILIDQEGNIVSADAPRPSSGAELTEMLDSLLGLDATAVAAL